MSGNTLYYGDNLDVLRRHIRDETVDLVYLDPPFNSKQDYNVLFAEHSGERSAAQFKAFEDTWHWDPRSEAAYQEIVETGGRVSEVMQAFRAFLGTSDMMAYLAMMAPRLVELRRVLKPTGSIYLHCDPAASHYLKIVMDAIFGPGRFLNEIAWKRTTAHNDPKRYGRIGDRLLFYSNSAKKTFNRVPGEYSPEQLRRYKYKDKDGRYRAENLTAPHFSPTRTIPWRGVPPGADRQWRFSTEELERLYSEGRILLRRDGCPRKDGLKVYIHEAEGAVLQDIWTDIGMGPTAGERLGFPTQKPEALLERIIRASSNEGDLVLDPFCGCGTAVAVAHLLKRRWIGIDVTHLAVNLIKHRLRDTFSEAVRASYTVVGEPEDLTGAEELARSDPYQFQWWALGLVGARRADGKKGADKGIDGRLYFHDEQKGGKTKQIIFSVKSGHLTAPHLRELRGVVEREKAAIGVLISLEEPTKFMRREAAGAGLYEAKGWGKFPRIQLLTVRELLMGATVKYPPTRGEQTFRKAPRAGVNVADSGLPFDADPESNEE